MKRCQRCRCASLQVLRESVTRRRNRQYDMTWLVCTECQEVNFSFHLLSDLPGLGPDRDADVPRVTEPTPVTVP